MEGNDAHRETASLLGEKCLPSPLITCEKLVGVWVVFLYYCIYCILLYILYTIVYYCIVYNIVYYYKFMEIWDTSTMPMGGHHPLQHGRDPTFISSNTSRGV